MQPQLPVNLGVRSSGEYLFAPSATNRLAAQIALEMAAHHAARLGMTRRAFLATPAGMLTTLAAINMASACRQGSQGSDSGGTTDAYGSSTDPLDEVTCDQEAGRELLSGTEFIFDVQTHHIQLETDWRDTNLAYRIFYDDILPMGLEDCTTGAECFDADHYADLVFGQSDTTVAVLSGLPALTCEEAKAGEMCGNPIDNAQMAASAARFNELAASQRMIHHAMVIPNEGLPRALAQMEADAAAFDVRAWKCYTPWGQIPAEQVAALEGLSESELILMAASGQIKGTGWRLDDPEIGIPFIEKGLELGVDIFCCHKGLPLPTFDPAFTSSNDLCQVASRYQQARFIVYHSSFSAGALSILDQIPEGPYGTPDADPNLADKGINDLLQSMEIHGIGPDSNVYAELGGLWSNVMGDAVQAQHAIGKLLKYLGPRRILWGTDAVWTGTPQPLIEAFRMFRISPEFQERYGYPELTSDDKLRILGLNAAELYGIDVEETRCTVARDELTRRRSDVRGIRTYEPRPAPIHLGPANRREFVRRWWGARDEPG